MDSMLTDLEDELNEAAEIATPKAKDLFLHAINELPFVPQVDVDNWRKAETGTIDQAEIHLNFESFSMLASVLTPKRLELMKLLRQQGLLSIRALSKQLGRDYKNVHTDAIALEDVGLIQRSEEGLLVVPWDVIDAHVRLVA